MRFHHTALQSNFEVFFGGGSEESRAMLRLCFPDLRLPTKFVLLRQMKIYVKVGTS